MVSVAYRRHTKYVLIALSAFFMLVFFVCTVIYSDKGHTPIPSLKHENHALNPHFHSLDEKGQPYSIDATRGYTMAGDEMFLLKKPLFSLTLQNGTIVKVTAEKGYLNKEQMNLKLYGNVNVSYGEETRFRMPFSEIDLRTSEIKGDQSILGGSEKLTLHAGTFHIEEKGAKITLTDKPVLRFNVQK